MMPIRSDRSSFIEGEGVFIDKCSHAGMREKVLQIIRAVSGLVKAL